jgi:hypothetical protein
MTIHEACLRFTRGRKNDRLANEVVPDRVASGYRSRSSGSRESSRSVPSRVRSAFAWALNGTTYAVQAAFGSNATDANVQGANRALASFTVRCLRWIDGSGWEFQRRLPSPHLRPGAHAAGLRRQRGSASGLRHRRAPGRPERGSRAGSAVRRHTMTTRKARKRATRERMAKTGERSAAARRHTGTKLPRGSRSRGWPTPRSALAAARPGTSGAGSWTPGVRPDARTVTSLGGCGTNRA